MHLIFHMTCVLLTVPAASTSNERVHSVAGRIMSKLRCSLTSENLDRNMMGWKMLRKTANDAAASLGKAPEIGSLDDAVDQLIDDLGAAELSGTDLDVDVEEGADAAMADAAMADGAAAGAQL